MRINGAGGRHAIEDLNRVRPEFGLHALDVSLTLGDLVEIVGRQGKAWAAASR